MSLHQPVLDRCRDPYRRKRDTGETVFLPAEQNWARQFIASISHELRTSLLLLLAPLEEALAQPAGALSSTDRERVTVARHNGLRLLQLVNMLLEFSRFEAGTACEPPDQANFTADLVDTVRLGLGAGSDTLDRLTPRQREVLQLVARGRSAKGIASILHISPRTAEFHKARLMEVLGIQTSAELTQFAIRAGLITV